MRRDWRLHLAVFLLGVGLIARETYHSKFLWWKVSIEKEAEAQAPGIPTCQFDCRPTPFEISAWGDTGLVTLTAAFALLIWTILESAK
ncbi:hypothetical protein ERY430_60402 [Erythrobacter sp. EC-HK427]|nr:hypothetical protein ERY430_60402 [Erythrobacter sp. EC-HK427]